MPRVNIYFSEGTHQRLQYYIKKTYGGHKATSLVTQQAVNEFLKPHFDKCEKCGQAIEVGTKNGVVLHHIIPLDKGGTDEPDNIMILCKSCHSKIHDIAAIMRSTKKQKKERQR